METFLFIKSNISLKLSLGRSIIEKKKEKENEQSEKSKKKVYEPAERKSYL